MTTAQAGQADIIRLVTRYASRRIIKKEPGKDGKYNVILDLQFTNGMCVKTRKEFEALKKIPAFVELLHDGDSGIGVLGETKIQPRAVVVPEVTQGVVDVKTTVDTSGQQ
jgi:hypothetical protein